jgi:cytochrome c oxidase cbb3-type subunit III
MQRRIWRVVSWRAATCTALLLAGAVPQTITAQPPQGRGGQNAGGQGRGGRGGEGTREFLGLGRVPDPAVAARGEALYTPNCAFCHGADARGAEGPNLVRSEIVLHDDAGELIGPVLLKGRLDAGMPAFSSLTPDQIAEIAEFLHMQVEKAANRGTYGSTFANRDILTGDPKAGETYFNGAGGCKSCHSPTGDLARVGSKYQPVNLQNRWLWPGGGGRGGGRGANAPVKATITLPSGETITGTVKRLDDFDVALIDGNGNYRSWPREGIKVDVPDPLAAHRRLLDQYSDTDVHNVTAYLATLK